MAPVTDLRLRRAAGRRHGPDVRVPLPRQPVDRLSDEPPVEPWDSVEDSVELSRLLRLAGLSPAQAVEVGAGLLAAVVARSDPDEAWTR